MSRLQDSYNNQIKEELKLKLGLKNIFEVNFFSQIRLIQN